MGAQPSVTGSPRSLTLVIRHLEWRWKAVPRCRISGRTAPSTIPTERSWCVGVLDDPGMVLVPYHSRGYRVQVCSRALPTTPLAVRREPCAPRRGGPPHRAMRPLCDAFGVACGLGCGHAMPRPRARVATGRAIPTKLTGAAPMGGWALSPLHLPLPFPVLACAHPGPACVATPSPAPCLFRMVKFSKEPENPATCKWGGVVHTPRLCSPHERGVWGGSRCVGPRCCCLASTVPTPGRALGNPGLTACPCPLLLPIACA